MRIVSDYPVGGRSTYGLQPVYHNLSKTQASNGHDVQVIARRNPGQPSLEVVDGVTIHRAGGPFTANALKKVRILVTENSSVIHTHSTSGAFLAAARRLVRAPIVSQVHGTTYSVATPAVFEFGSIRNGYSHWRVTTSYLREKALWSVADKIAVVSTSVQSDLVSRYGIPDQKIRLIYNGVDADLFRTVGPSKATLATSMEGKKVVLYVGHFGIRKGLPFLIRAMGAVAKEVKDSALLCVGGIPPWLPPDQYTAHLNQLVDANGLEGRVTFLNRVDHSELPSFYSMASAFVLPSYYEAFPKVLIEAMACERAVIATYPGGTSDSVEEGVNGFLVPYANPEALARRITTLLQDEGLAKRMGSSGRRRVLDDFTWHAVAARLDSVYQEVLAN